MYVAVAPRLVVRLLIPDDAIGGRAATNEGRLMVAGALHDAFVSGASANWADGAAVHGAAHVLAYEVGRHVVRIVKAGHPLQRIGSVKEATARIVGGRERLILRRDLLRVEMACPLANCWEPSVASGALVELLEEQRLYHGL